MLYSIGIGTLSSVFRNVDHETPHPIGEAFARLAPAEMGQRPLADLIEQTRRGGVASGTRISAWLDMVGTPALSEGGGSGQ